MMNLSFMQAFKFQQKQALINKNYNEIYAHESAHKRAGGSLAGPIVIEKNPDGIPVGGHVSVKMPSLDKDNPQKTIDQADIVFRAAMAPFNPSEQDYRVASEAKNLQKEAETYKSRKKLDFYA